MTSLVYRNLNTGLWSVKQRRGGKWQVVAHCAAVTLEQCSVKQSEAGRQRAIRDGQRNVHCFAVGTLVGASGVNAFKGRALDIEAPSFNIKATRGITYNPFQHETLVYRDNETAYTGSNVAEFTASQKMLVS